MAGDHRAGPRATEDEVITRRQLISALGRRTVADWVLIERTRESYTRSEASKRHRAEHRTTWTVIVHHDLPRGRGTARTEVGGLGDSARVVVDRLVSQAAATIGPAWRSTPPAAPAKVELLDPQLKTVPLPDVARALIETGHDALTRDTGAAIASTVCVARDVVAVEARSGFHTSWTASELNVRGLITAGDRSTEVTRRARRLADLGLGEAVTTAARDLTLLREAAIASPGRCAVVLGPDAMVHGGELGIWQVFADQASAALERQGLTRYRLGAAIAPGATDLAEPLTIASDGSLDFGARSAPVSDDGDAVRRFTLIDRGTAAGLGLSMREAARRNADPNGGVRNLVVAPGSWDGRVGPRRAIEIRWLRSLLIDRYTADANLEIALAIDHLDGKQRPISGGMIRLDLIAALARARRSATKIARNGYYGPSAIVIDDVELLS
ncbi:MAG: metallopeptidase TldD-related protein [Kofleriaceae bacterium]